MITFEENNTRFVLRAAGVLLDGQRVLLHRVSTATYWALPGGRVEYLENSINAIEREMKEELNLEVEVEKLLWVVENFAEESGKYHHELGFYYLLFLPENSTITTQKGPFKGIEADQNLIFQWFDLDSLQDIIVYPTFLKEALRSLPGRIEHIIHKE